MKAQADSPVLEMLKALADQSPLRIVSLIWEGGGLCGCEIERVLGIKQSNASRHMRRLREGGVVESYKKAQWHHYRIAENHRTKSGMLASILESARNQDQLLQEDLKRLQDYRSRGFTCATIHEWVPFDV